MSTDNYLKEIVGEIAQRENYREYDFTWKPGSNKGNNYLSVLYIVTIDGITKLGKKKKLELIVKCALPGKKLREAMPINEIFKREIFFYEVLCKVYDELQKGVEDKLQYKEHARIYYTCDVEEKECIAMGNLREEGYCLYDRNQGMTEDHVELVMKAYGKYHGMSLVLKEKDQDSFDKLRKETYQLMDDQFDSTVGSFEMEIAKWITYFNEKEWPLVQRLRTFKKKLRDEMNNNRHYRGDHPVFLHGDCWCNNFLFKYGKSDTPHVPTDVKMIDFQIVSVGNVMTDLTYFLYSCTDSNIYDNYEKYLKVYHQSMAELLKEFDMPIQEVFPYSTLKSYWKEFAPIGLMIASVIMKLNFSKPDEAVNLADVCDGNILDSFYKAKIDGKDLVKEKIVKMIRHMFANEFI